MFRSSLVALLLVSMGAVACLPSEDGGNPDSGPGGGSPPIRGENGGLGVGSDAGTTSTADGGATGGAATDGSTTGGGTPDGSTTDSGTTDGGTTGGGTDGGSAGTGAIGDACTTDGDCQSAACVTEFEGGYCVSFGCAVGSCPSGSDCFIIDDQDNTACLSSCVTSIDCRTAYTCVSAGACIPGTDGSGGGTATGPLVGSACTADGECGTNPESYCLPETDASGDTGWLGGYCLQLDCQAGTCPAGSDCFIIDSNNNTSCLATCATSSDCRAGYACDSPGVCMPGCTAGSCGPGLQCGPDGTCRQEACTVTSCPAGMFCGTGGACEVDLGSPPSGPVPDCSWVTGWQCAGGEAYCGTLIPFTPEQGPGYWNYPLNGETSTNQYRSYARRDLVQLVKHASAFTDCISQSWPVGNGLPVGLGDMSEQNGAIPGTSINSPGHPAGTHTDGHDMDIAYHQLLPPDNKLRAVCDHYSGGVEQYHCTTAPDNLDVWRTAAFLAAFHESPQLRVIGVDGQIGQQVESAVSQLCAAGFLNGPACSRLDLAYEVTDTQRGWFRFHHHHSHVSIVDRPTAGLSSFRTTPFRGSGACLTGDCSLSLFDPQLRIEPLPRAPRSVF